MSTGPDEPSFVSWTGPTSEPEDATAVLERQTTEALAYQAGLASRVREVALGHRRQLEADGISEELAQQAAMHLHALLLQRWLG